MPFPGIKNFTFIFAFLSVISFQSKAQKNQVQIISSEYIFENAPFEACHASTLVEIDNKTIISAWFGGKHEGSNDVSIWSSTNKNGKWSKPVEIANGI